MSQTFRLFFFFFFRFLPVIHIILYHHFITVQGTEHGYLEGLMSEIRNIPDQPAPPKKKKTMNLYWAWFSRSWIGNQPKSSSLDLRHSNHVQINDLGIMCCCYLMACPPMGSRCFASISNQTHACILRGCTLNWRMKSLGPSLIIGSSLSSTSLAEPMLVWSLLTVIHISLAFENPPPPPSFPMHYSHSCLL